MICAKHRFPRKSVHHNRPVMQSDLMPPPVFRFAPSPNGFLHLGHAYSALLNIEAARRSGGRFLLRIEDIDAARCRPEFEAAIYDDLAWLGVSWEMPVRRQSEHLAEYRAEREARGTWPRDPDGTMLYPGAAKSLPSDERERLLQSGAPFALRLDMEAACRLAGDLAWTERGSGPD